MKFNEDYTVDIDSLTREEAIACVVFFEGERDLSEMFAMTAMEMVMISGYEDTYRKLSDALATQLALDVERKKRLVETIVDKYKLTPEEISGYSPFVKKSRSG